MLYAFDFVDKNTITNMYFLENNSIKGPLLKETDLGLNHNDVFITLRLFPL